MASGQSRLISIISKSFHLFENLREFQINNLGIVRVVSRLLATRLRSMRTVVTMLLLCGAAAFGQELPDAPSFSRTNQNRTVDKAFWITAGVYGASIAGDAITKSLWAGQSSTCPRDGVLSGPLGKSPTSARAGLIMAGEFAIASVVGYEFKKHDLRVGKVRLWKLPFLARTYAHGHNMFNNLAVCH